MPPILDLIRAALKRPKSTTAQLAEALDLARKADTEARAAVDKAVAAVSAGFMDEAAKRQADRNTLAAARESAEDATAVLAEVERRHAAALAIEEEASRRLVYDAAKAQADAAAVALSRAYPKLAAGMISMLKDLAQAQLAVAAANAQLPGGAEPIIDPEMAARCVLGLPREVVSDEWVELWGRYDLDEPVDAVDQSRIYDCGNGWGKARPRADGGDLSIGEPQPNYRRRRFHKVVTREPTNGDWPLPLAASLQLPAVRGSGVLLGESHPVYTPGLSMTLLGQAEPAAVLARLADADAVASAKPARTERRVRVEWVEHVDVVPLPEVRVLDTMSRRSQMQAPVRHGSSPMSLPSRGAGRR